MANNNGNMFDAYGISKMLEMISDNYEQNQSLAKNNFAEQMLRQILEVMKVGNAHQLDKKDIQAAFKDVLTPLLKSAFGGGSELTNYLKILQNSIEAMTEKQAITAELLANMMSGGVSLGYSTSERAVATGMGNKPFNIDSKTAKGSEVAKMLESIFGSKIAKKLDSVTDKILAFFGEDRSTRRSRTRQFIDDLAEGLSKSKWVGGALMDIVKMVSYFAANWLKQFGPIGKALAVGVVALAPIVGTIIANILAKALVNSLTNVVKYGLLGLGTLLKATFLSLTQNGLFKAALQGNPFAKGAAVSKGNLAIGSFMAATAVGALAVDSFKKGGARENTAGTALGIGALGFAVTGIAALIGGSIAAAVLPIALPVAAIATGIGLIVKFLPQIMDFFRYIGEKLGLIAGKEEDGGYKGGAPTVFENMNKDFSGEKGSNLVSKKQGKELSADEMAAWKKADEQKAIVGADGSIRNFGQMTQQQAAREMERVRKENPEAWNNLYEFVEFGKYGKKEDFGTDLISSDGKGFYAAKGSMARMDAANAYLESKGYRGTLKFTGGIATAGNIETLQASPHKLTGKGHDNPYGIKMDIGQASIDQVVNAQGKKAPMSLIDEAIKSEGAWEGAKVVNEGDHRDILWASGELRNMVRGAKENKKQWVEAAKQTIEIRKEEVKKATAEAQEDKNNGLTSAQSEKIKNEEEKLAALKTAQSDLRTLEKQPDQFFTGNEAVSSVLKDTVVFAQYQKNQQ